MKKSTKYQTLGMSIGMCLGVSFGITFGQTAFDNMPIGMCMGLSVGMAIGMAIGAAKDKAINDQVEQMGYVITEIIAVESAKEFRITVRNKAEEETVVVVPSGIMEEETFCVGDVVFMDEDGMIEQAFEEEEN